MLAHSSTEGRWRFSGLAFQSAERSASRSSARPRRVCSLLAGQPVADRGNEVVVRQLIVAGHRLACSGSRTRRLFGARCRSLRRRDQSHVVIEGPQQVVELSGTIAVARHRGQFLVRPHVALDVRAALGQQGLQDRCAAFWWPAARPSGTSLRGRRRRPPRVPPSSLRVAGAHGLPLTISANNARRIGITRRPGPVPRWPR